MIMWYKKGMEVEFRISNQNGKCFNGEIVSDRIIGAPTRVWVKSIGTGEVCIKKYMIKKVKI